MKLLLAALLIGVLCSSVEAKPPIFLYSLNDAQKISKDLNLPILIIVSADWCLYCNKLDKTISNHLELFNNTIILKINFDSNAEFVKQYKIKKIPTIVYQDKKYVGIYNIEDLKKILGK